MTTGDETSGPVPEPEATTPAPTPPAAPAARRTAAGGERLLLIAALGLLGGYLLFGLILGEWIYADIKLTPAALLVLAWWTRTKASTWGVPYGSALKFLGYVIAILAAFDFLERVRFGFPDEAIDVIAVLVGWAAGVLAFLGARGVKTA